MSISGYTCATVQFIVWVCYACITTFLLPRRRLCFRRCLSVCLLATLCKNFQTDLHESFREGWAIDQLIKFWWQSGSLLGYRDCFPDSSLLRDTEEKWYQPSKACTSRRRHSNYDVITLPSGPWRRYALSALH